MPIAVNPQSGEAAYLTPDGRWAPARTAVNPQTGEKLAFDGQQWQPLGGGKQGGGVMQTVDDIVRRIASGATGGFADEIAAGLGTGFGYLGDYEKRLAEERARDRAFSESSPVTSTVAEVGGAIASPMMKVAGPFMAGAPGAGLAARMARGAVGGAGLGAIYGVGGAEGDLIDRAKGAGVGAAFGGAIGGVAPPVIDAVSAAGRGVYNQIAGRLPFQQETVAARKVAEALAREGLTPEQAAARVRELGPQAALMDVGGNPQSLARAAATVPGEGKTAISEFLRARQEGTRAADATLRGGQINRVSQAIDDLIPSDVRATRQGVLDARATFGKSYEAARAADDLVDIKPVIGSLDDEITKSKGGIQSALKKVRSYLVDESGRPEITVDTLHQAKMAIDDLMSGEARTSMGNVAKARIRAYQDKLVDAIESAGEAGAKYREGRLGTAAAWRINDALDAGEQFMTKRAGTASELSASLKDMRPEEIEAFRQGAAQAIKSKLGDLNTRTDVTKRIMDIPNLEAKIRVAFGSPDTFKKYITALQGERAMFDTYGKIMGGSRTGEVLAEQADAQIDPSRVMQGLRRAASSNPLDWIAGGAEAIGGAKDRLLMPQGTARELAKILMGQDVAPLQGAYRAAGIDEARRRSLARMLTAAGASRQGQ